MSVHLYGYLAAVFSLVGALDWAYALHKKRETVQRPARMMALGMLATISGVRFYKEESFVLYFPLILQWVFLMGLVLSTTLKPKILQKPQS